MRLAFIVLPPDEEDKSYSPEEALAMLAELPPGIGFGAVLDQEMGGNSLAVITTASKPLLPAYVCISYDISPDDPNIPTLHTTVGYEDFSEFAEIVRRAPVSFPPCPWVRMDVMASYWMAALAEMHDELEWDDDDDSPLRVGRLPQ